MAAKRKKRRAPPLGEYIKFYCYGNIKHENRKFYLVFGDTVLLHASSQPEKESGNGKSSAGVRTEKLNCLLLPIISC